MSAVSDQKPPTEEQARALGVAGSSVALSAGAGCGKTFVLAERFVRASKAQRRGRWEGSSR